MFQRGGISTFPHSYVRKHPTLWTHLGQSIQTNLESGHWVFFRRGDIGPKMWPVIQMAVKNTGQQEFKLKAEI